MVFAGTDWVTANAGSKFKLDMVVTDNAYDPMFRSAVSSCRITAKASSTPAG